MIRIAMNRRTLIALTVAAMLAPTRFAFAARCKNQARRIPQTVDARVIVDNDFAGDPDGLFALAHQLLSLKSVTKLITVSQLDTKFVIPGVAPATSVARGIAITRELIRRLKPAYSPPIAGGQENAADRAPSDAAKAIVAEAMRDDPLPLWFCCGGPLTNLAAALRLEPKIASRMKLIWIGGEPYPDGGWEYNLSADPDAARTVIEGTTIPIWQITRKGYRMMSLSIAEFESDFKPISPFTEWLYQRFTDVPDFVKLPGAWPMGDTPLVTLSSITPESSPSVTVKARRILPDLKYGAEIPGRTIEVSDTPDARLAFADFRARLIQHSR